MAIIKIIFIITCIVAIPIILIDCPKLSKDKTYTIEMVRVDSKLIIGQYKLPESAILFIDEDRGSYYLTYNLPTYLGIQKRGETLKSAVIDFKVISIK